LGTIQTDGTLTDIVTLESPDAELEQACRTALEQWRYAPMKLDGVPTRSDTLIVFEFNLRNSEVHFVSAG
jgi:outer membrane biosynthesis protein TonB